MRTSLRAISSLALTGLLAAGVAGGAQAAISERGLLGVHIWNSFRDVLAKYGQPTRIEVGAVTSPMGGGGGGNLLGGGGPMGSSGMGLPGLPGMGPMGGSMGGRGKMGAMGAMGAGAPMGMGGGTPYPGSPMGGGSPYGGSPMGAGSPYGKGGGMGPMGMGGGMLSGSGGMAGAPIGGEGGGSMMGPYGGSGMGPGMGAGGSAQTGAEGEVTWVYEKSNITYMFLFNKDGRVIQIQEFGRSGGSSTSRGVRLGDSVDRVYRLYGWADNSATNGTQLTLDYGTKAHVAFQLLNEGKGSKVVGITVALTEKTQIPAAQ